MDHAISQLKDYMWAVISTHINHTKSEMREEIKAYVEALNVLEKHHYGEKVTSLDRVLSNFKEG